MATPEKNPTQPLPATAEKSRLRRVIVNVPKQTKEANPAGGFFLYQRFMPAGQNAMEVTEAEYTELRRQVKVVGAITMTEDPTDQQFNRAHAEANEGARRRAAQKERAIRERVEAELKNRGPDEDDKDEE